MFPQQCYVSPFGGDSETTPRFENAKWKEVKKQTNKQTHKNVSFNKN